MNMGLLLHAMVQYWKGETKVPLLCTMSLSVYLNGLNDVYQHVYQLHMSTRHVNINLINCQTV